MTNNSILAMEHPLIKVPIESLNKAFRVTQRNLEKESTIILSQLDDLTQKANKPEANSEEATERALEHIVERLRVLKRKVEDNLDEEENQIVHCKLRLDNINVPEKEQMASWSNIRKDRVIVDHLLRNGHYYSAQAITDHAHLHDLVDTNIFLERRKMEDALDRHECGEALAWCFENRSRLKKMKSTLETNLRMQELIEMVRDGRRIEAISHARRYLATNASNNLEGIFTAMGTLAFTPDTNCPKYKALFASERWASLKAQYRHDHYALYSLPTQSLLTITLQAGLSAFKTRACYQEEGRHQECPVCSWPMNQLAEGLPFYHRIHSTIVCHLTGEVIVDPNAPMALPNGYVYGMK
eukprot:Ihof_evm5s87 gene=Ihof_evmTU5s87